MSKAKIWGVSQEISYHIIMLFPLYSFVSYTLLVLIYTPLLPSEFP